MALNMDLIEASITWHTAQCIELEIICRKEKKRNSFELWKETALQRKTTNSGGGDESSSGKKVNN